MLYNLEAPVFQGVRISYFSEMLIVQNVCCIHVESVGLCGLFSHTAESSDFGFLYLLEIENNENLISLSLEN